MICVSAGVTDISEILSPLSSLVKSRSRAAERVHALHLILRHVGERWSPTLLLRSPVLPSIWSDSGLASVEGRMGFVFFPLLLPARSHSPSTPGVAAQGPTLSLYGLTLQLVFSV